MSRTFRIRLQHASKQNLIVKDTLAHHSIIFITLALLAIYHLFRVEDRGAAHRPSRLVVVGSWLVVAAARYHSNIVQYGCMCRSSVADQHMMYLLAHMGELARYSPCVDHTADTDSDYFVAGT